MTSKPLPSLNRLRELIIYDRLTGAMTWRVEVPHQGSGKRRVAGAIATSYASNGYLRIFIDGEYYAAHRVAFKLANDREPIGEIDHIDGKRDRNADVNLREASRSENARNLASWAVLGKGVSRGSGKEKPYQARICGVSIGHFATVEEARAAYDAAAQQQFGQFATTRQVAQAHKAMGDMDRPLD